MNRCLFLFVFVVLLFYCEVKKAKAKQAEQVCEAKREL
jgi:hypothetical protein